MGLFERVREAYDKELAISRMGGRYRLLEFVDDEQIRKELKYAASHPLRVPKPGLINRLTDYLSKHTQKLKK